MPIYEYRCDPCSHEFETLIRGQGDVAHCPKCASLDVARRFSVPAAAKTGGGLGVLPQARDVSPAYPGGGCGAGGCGSGMCGLD